MYVCTVCVCVAIIFTISFKTLLNQRRPQASGHTASFLHVHEMTKNPRLWKSSKYVYTLKHLAGLGFVCPVYTFNEYSVPSVFTAHSRPGYNAISPPLTDGFFISVVAILSYFLLLDLCRCRFLGAWNFRLEPTVDACLTEGHNYLLLEQLLTF